MSVTITPLHCGTLTAARSMFVADGGDDAITVPVPSWLVRHPQGNVLFDTGMPHDLAAPSEYLDLVSLFFTVGVDDSTLVGGALAGVDAGPDDIDVVVLSHLHFDHAGGLASIPDARVVVHADEWAAGADDELAAANSFRQSEYQLGHDVQTVDGEHDLFGDGLVTCIPTPGHTPGHQSLRVRLADREVVLAGDCAYFADTLDGGALPGIGHDHAAQTASIARLRAMRDAGATVIPGHDPDVFAALPTVLS